MSQTLKIGSRSSPLALKQVEEVLGLLKSKGVSLEASIIKFKTVGDIDKNTSLTSTAIADNFFTDSLDLALLNSDIDIAIHSAKDLPKHLHHDLEVYALTKGLEDSDSWVSPYALHEFPQNGRVGTSSLVRQQAIKALRPDIQIVDIRGTIDERLHLIGKTIDALIVATCALKRLNLSAHIKEVLPWPGMPLQGQLAITGKKGNHHLKNIFKDIDVRKSYGTVTLVGAGPGDKDLITLKGINALKKADCVFYDYLVDENLLQYAYRAEHIFAGKRKGCHSIKQQDLNVLLKNKAQEGLNVVRLKGGDPFIFGRGFDEWEFLKNYHIPVNVIPGISSATGLASLLGIPLTARGLSNSVSFITAHSEDEHDSTKSPLIIPSSDTVVIFMGLSKLTSLVKSFIDQGWKPTTPVLIVSNGSKINQQLVKGQLLSIESLINNTNILPPALIIVGKSVDLFQPLADKTYLHCGTHPEIYRNIARIIPWPMIDIQLKEFTPLEKENFNTSILNADMIVLTSRFAAKQFINLLSDQSKQHLKQKIIAIIGEHTGETLRHHGINPDIQAPIETAQGLFDQLKKLIDLKGKKIFFPRSNLSNPYLKESLIASGADVDEIAVYINTKPAFRALPNDLIDGIIFTSPSTVENFITDYQKIPSTWDIIAKGEVTAKALTTRGYLCRIVSVD